MARRAILDPEKKAASAAKVKASVAKAGKKRNEAKAVERVSQAAQDRSSYEDDVAYKLREGAPVAGAPAKQNAEAAMRAGAGPMAREYYNPKSPLNSGVYKEATKDAATGLKRAVGRPTRLTDNPNHSIALDSIAEEVRSRLNHIAPQQIKSLGLELYGQKDTNYSDRNNRLSVANAHLDRAQRAISDHQTAHSGGRYKAALEHLTTATDAINDAVETSIHKPSLGLPRDVGLEARGGAGSASIDSNHLFANRWKPNGQEWNEGESGSVDLHKVHSLLNGIRTGYITDLRASDKVGPAKLDEAIASSPNLSAGRNYKPGTLSPTASVVHDKVLPTLDSAGAISTREAARSAVQDAKDDAIRSQRESFTGIEDKNKGMFLKEKKDEDFPGSPSRMATTLGLMPPASALSNYTKAVTEGKVKLPEGMELGTKEAKKYLKMELSPAEKKRKKETELSIVPDSGELEAHGARFARPEPSEQDFGDNLRPEAHSEGYVPEKAVQRRNQAFGAGMAGGR
jgi:hypothetical protein